MKTVMVAAAGALIVATTTGAAEPAPETKPVLKPIVDLRLRSESVEQQGLAEDAQALTLRARLGFETASILDTVLLAEAELVWPWTGDYNSTLNGATGFPVVADPETHELNRLQLANTSLPHTTVILGRQRMNLDDQRFIGAVGWRQNEQTFDSVRLINKSLAHLTFDLAYIEQVNRIFGSSSPAGRYHGENYVANASWQTAFGTLTGFAYLLDFEEASADSSRTLGARFVGSRPVGRMTVGYSAAYATQRERAGNPLRYRDDYRAFELSGIFRGYAASAGMEVLEGNGVKGFSTPLATLHKFQGWADKFLTTPADGINDRYLTAAYTKKAVGTFETLSLTASYHFFDSQRLAIDYGTELDVQLQAKWKHFTGSFKYADYQAQQFATDTRKIWAQIEYIR